MSERICPVCGRIYIEPPALSRKDNETEICSECGQKEALEMFARGWKSDCKRKTE